MISFSTSLNLLFFPAGDDRPPGLPVATAGPKGSGGHEGAEGAQRVSAVQHPALSCGTALPGQGSP